MQAYAIGPIVIGTERLPPLLGAQMSAFAVADRPATVRFVVQNAGGDERGDPTVPLPAIRRDGDAVALSSEGLAAVFATDTLHVARAANVGEVASAFRWLLAHALLAREALLLHGVGLMSEGRAAVFTGHSGAGKSTLGHFASQGGLVLLSDELVIIDAELRAHGTPWNVGSAQAGRLAMIGTLGWAADATLREADAAPLFKLLSQNVLVPDPSPQGKAALFRVMSRIVHAVPSVQLDFPQSRAVGPALRSELLRR